MLVQPRFDFTQFNSISTFHDHPIPPADVEIITIFVFDDDITRFIPALPRGIDEESVCCSFRKIPVAMHDSWSSPKKLTLLPYRDDLTLFVNHLDEVVGTSFPNWERLGVVLRDGFRNFKKGAYVGFSRAI